MVRFWLLLVLPAFTANAASLDCSNAHTPFEKAVCTSPVLRALDEQMNVAYGKLMAAAPAEFKGEVRENQRHWLQHRGADCRGYAAENADEVAICLKSDYQDRIKELHGSLASTDGVSFFWRSKYVTAPDQVDKSERTYFEENPGFGTLSASWPQALSREPEWVAWNRAMEAAACGQSPTDAHSAKPATWTAEPDIDAEVSVSLRWVGSRLVAATIHNLWNGHGAHPNSSSSEFNWLLDEQRSVRPEDLFRLDADWKASLYRMTDSYLHQALDDQNNGDYHTWDSTPDGMTKTVRKIAENPANWGLSKNGITIVFQPYAVACYACTPEPFTMTWTQLRPLLNSAFELPH